MARFLGRANRILDSEGDLALFIELYCPFPVTDDQLRSLLRDYLHYGKNLEYSPITLTSSYQVMPDISPLLTNSMAREVAELTTLKQEVTDDTTSTSQFCMTIGSGDDPDSELAGVILAHAYAKESNSLKGIIPGSVKECINKWADKVMGRPEYQAQVFLTLYSSSTVYTDIQDSDQFTNHKATDKPKLPMC